MPERRLDWEWTELPCITCGKLIQSPAEYHRNRGHHDRCFRRESGLIQKEWNERRQRRAAPEHKPKFVKQVHFCVDIRGVLRYNNRDLLRQFKGVFSTDAGMPLKTADEIRNVLYDEIAKGHELLPFGDCDNFDYKKGCRGHQIKEDETHG